MFHYLHLFLTLVQVKYLLKLILHLYYNEKSTTNFDLPIYPFPNVAADIFMVIQENLKKLLSGDDIKAIQKAVISLGHICMMETSTSRLNIATDLIFSLCRSRVSS